MRPKFSSLLLDSFSIAIIVLCEQSVQAIGASTVGTTTYELAIDNTEGYHQGEFFAAGMFWVYYTDGTNELMKSSTDGST
jgi:hypothetical protein